MIGLTTVRRNDYKALLKEGSRDLSDLPELYGADGCSVFRASFAPPPSVSVPRMRSSRDTDTTTLGI